MFSTSTDDFMTHVPYLAHRIHCDVPDMAHLAAGGEIRVWRRKVKMVTPYNLRGGVVNIDFQG